MASLPGLNRSSIQSSAIQTTRSEIVVINYAKLHKEPYTHLELRCIVRNSSTGEDIRHATVQFWPEGEDTSRKSRRLWDLSLVNDDHPRSLEEEANKKNETSLKLSYSGAVLSGVDQVPLYWPSRVKDSIASLAAYGEDGVAAIPLATLIGSSPQAVLKDLQNHNPGKLWKDYMDETPSVSWGELDNLYDGTNLAITSPVEQHSPRCHFSSLEDAVVKLSVARYIEQKWEEKMFQELCKGEFDAAFFLLGPDIAIACVRRKHPAIVIDPNAVWDEHMNVVLKLEVEAENDWGDSETSGEAEKTVRMMGHVVSNQTSVKCEIVLLLQTIFPKLYQFARPLKGPPRFIDLRDVCIEVNDDPAKSQIESLHAFFNREEPKFEKWWPMLLAQNGSSALRSNFLQKVGWTSQGFEQVLRKITEHMRAAGKHLNEEQLNILRDAPFSKAGFKLIMGPPGCGKTTLIAMMAKIYLGAPDVAILVVAASNGSTDRSFETLDKWMPNDQSLDTRLCPLRVHKKHVEFNHFLSEFDPVGKKARMQAAEKRSAEVLDGDDETSRRLFRFYERQQHAEKRKHLTNAGSGVAAVVWRAVQDGKLPRAPDPGNSASKPMHDVHRAGAASSLSLLLQHRSQLAKDISKGLRPGDKYKIKKAFDAIARYIIGTKRLIVSTAGNANSSILKDCIFRDAKHVIVVMDEAGLATDAELVNILAGLFTPERVSAEFGGKNPIVAMVLVGDHKQGAPIVKSDILKANIFGPQLAVSPFVRFTLSGFPMHHLWEQHRMVDILCKLPSTRGYDGRLRTSAQALCRRMTLQQRGILMTLLGAELSKVRCPPNGDRSYMEDQHLRHWLLDVRAGCTQSDPALRNSKFNIANVDVTLKFFRSLIKLGFLPPSEIRILTFYRAQRQRYIDGICALEQELDLTDGELHGIVHTSDSFQGQEATCIIMDLVVTKYFGEGTLGHAGDEQKANVAFTRARDFLFVVGDSTILDSQYMRDREERVEFIFESMIGLLARKAVTQCYSEKPPESELAGRFKKLGIEGKNTTSGIPTT